MELRQPSDVAEAVAALGDGAVALAGGTEAVPLLYHRLLSPTSLVDVRRVVPRGIADGRIGGGATLAELEVDPQVPDALREACRLCASPQLRAMSTIAGNLLQETRCWYWRLEFPCYLHGGDRCHAKEGEHREHAILGHDVCASASPSDIAAALLALDARLHTDRRVLGIGKLYRLPTLDDRRLTTLDPDELILEIEVPSAATSVYLKAMDRASWSFPIVGVAAARVGGETRLALSGAAPIPWLLAGPEALEEAVPLPQTGYKLEIARSLVRRALDSLTSY